MVSIIKNSNEILLTLINDILDYSKIKDGKITLESYPFNLIELIKNISSLFRSKC